MQDTMVVNCSISKFILKGEASVEKHSVRDDRAHPDFVGWVSIRRSSRSRTAKPRGGGQLRRSEEGDVQHRSLRRGRTRSAKARRQVRGRCCGLQGG